MPRLRAAPGAPRATSDATRRCCPSPPRPARLRRRSPPRSTVLVTNRPQCMLRAGALEAVDAALAPRPPCPVARSRRRRNRAPRGGRARVGLNIDPRQPSAAFAPVGGWANPGRTQCAGRLRADNPLSYPHSAPASASGARSPRRLFRLEAPSPRPGGVSREPDGQQAADAVALASEQVPRQSAAGSRDGRHTSARDADWIAPLTHGEAEVAVSRARDACPSSDWELSRATSSASVS